MMRARARGGRRRNSVEAVPDHRLVYKTFTSIYKTLCKAPRLDPRRSWSIARTSIRATCQSLTRIALRSTAPTKGPIPPRVRPRAWGTFLGTLVGGLLAAPLAAEGQQAPKIPKIGLLTLNTPAAAAPLVE